MRNLTIFLTVLLFALPFPSHAQVPFGGRDFFRLPICTCTPSLPEGASLTGIDISELACGPLIPPTYFFDFFLLFVGPVPVSGLLSIPLPGLVTFGALITGPNMWLLGFLTPVPVPCGVFIPFCLETALLGVPTPPGIGVCMPIMVSTGIVDTVVTGSGVGGFGFF